MVSKENKFYGCEKCHNVVRMIHDAGMPLVCCGNTMQELIPKSNEQGTEKHLPTAEFDKNILKVNVGEVSHPMTEEHSIKWIYVISQEGEQLKYLRSDREPKAEFSFINGDKPLEVYAYCNLHGLWAIEL